MSQALMPTLELCTPIELVLNLSFCKLNECFFLNLTAILESGNSQRCAANSNIYFIKTDEKIDNTSQRVFQTLSSALDRD